MGPFEHALANLRDLLIPVLLDLQRRDADQYDLARCGIGSSAWVSHLQMMAAAHSAWSRKMYEEITEGKR